MGATVDFAVTLSRSSSADVTVGGDYTSTSGTLTFAAGETAKTVAVPVFDDAINESAETGTGLDAAAGVVVSAPSRWSLR